ncbi:DUF58 domain-containing protein [Persephonella sp.]
MLLGVSAVNTGNNLVYLIVAAMLSFMVISGFAGRRNLEGLDLEVDLPEEIFAGTEFPIRVKLKNRKKFLPSFLLIFRLEDKKAVVSYIDPSGEQEFHLNFVYSSRGKKEITQFEICSVFPFNFFIRCIIYHKKIPVVVYPAPKKCSFPQEDSEKRKKEGVFSQGKGFYDELVSIRDYVAGDPLKFVHWKASAKTGRLKTKEMTDLSDRPVVIDMDKLAGNKEEKISCAAYLILEMYKRGVPFGLKYGNRQLKPEFSRRQKALLLTELAQL